MMKCLNTSELSPALSIKQLVLRGIHSLLSHEMFGEACFVFHLSCPLSILAFDPHSVLCNFAPFFFSFKLAGEEEAIKTHCVAVNQ